MGEKVKVLKNKAMEEEPLRDRFELKYANHCDACIHGETELKDAPCEKCEHYGDW